MTNEQRAKAVLDRMPQLTRVWHDLPLDNAEFEKMKEKVVKEALDEAERRGWNRAIEAAKRELSDTPHARFRLDVLRYQPEAKDGK